MGYKTKTTTYKYEGKNERKFIKEAIKLIYDADIEDVVFIDGNSRNLTYENIYINKSVEYE